jgi:hypothetical protein
LNAFLSRFGHLITGVLSGFDRVVFRGHLMPLMRDRGMYYFLESAGILLKDYKPYLNRTTAQLKSASLAEAQELGRPVQYLSSAKTDKEELARKLLKDNPIDEGLICVLKAVEPCRTFEYKKSEDKNERGLRLVDGKCEHLYHYYLHPRFGFCNARIQTWFPFNVQICLNGREWLVWQLTKEGRTDDFKRADNCLTWVRNPHLAQRRLDDQLKTDWPKALGGLSRLLNPLHPEIFRSMPMDYYWSAYQTEWATDVMFESQAALASIYPQLVQYAMNNFHSEDVMRFLAGKQPHGNYLGEISTSFKDRVEGVRVKHWLDGNSLKMYDKFAALLRIEATLAWLASFKVFRPPHDNPEGKLAWRQLRKGVADLHRRAEISQRANEAYLEALAVVEDTTPCAQLFDAVSKPVIKDGHRSRALRINDPLDVALLEAITRGEFAIAGFRNRDIRELLHPASEQATKDDLRRLSAKTSRQLRLLRDHGLIRKIPKTHRYQLTERGRQLTAALFATRKANIKQLLAMAA